MAKKRKPPSKRETKMMRELGGGQNTYLGEVAAPPEKKTEVATPDSIKKLDPREIRFLKGYLKTGTYAGGYRAMRPKAADSTAWKMGSLMWKRISEKLSLAEIHEALGVSLGSVDRVLAEGMEAKFSRQFITREGEVITAPPQEDHPTRISAAKEAARILKLTEDAGEGIRVAVTIFCKPEERNTWPGSEGNVDSELDFDRAHDITPPDPDKKY